MIMLVFQSRLERRWIDRFEGLCYHTNIKSTVIVLTNSDKSASLFYRQPLLTFETCHKRAQEHCVIDMNTSFSNVFCFRLISEFSRLNMA